MSLKFMLLALYQYDVFVLIMNSQKPLINLRLVITNILKRTKHCLQLHAGNILCERNILFKKLLIFYVL